jgi:hypothetical protein
VDLVPTLAGGDMPAAFRAISQERWIKHLT